MTQLELALTLEEKDWLAQCEVVIERGLGVFIETGEALMTVRNERLYRADFASFEDYCRDRWSLSPSRAYQMIDAANVVETIISTIVGEIHSEDDAPSIPATESQARELAPLLDDPEELCEVWEEAVERTAGKPTAATIKAVREEREEARQEAEPVVWSDLEVRMRGEVEAGRIVVASLRGGHHNLIAWAESTDRYVRIDRRTAWGNPFELPGDGDREAVIANYRDHYLPHKPSLLSRLDDLRGKVLGCWCAPEFCHGDVLKARAEE